ncbi:hypothetical protein E2562_020409 [Oryza meyeriana var. granulata]|uniref:Uncharacterized protein n=1 Tax=Oryza meyeriana var. granulata TaxID=110450 RepID=A0A6G1DKV3_9ORYZ|nr:hypothetical protein E2562_020409 [Oryza meyeriana var. granulata]
MLQSNGVGTEEVARDAWTLAWHDKRVLPLPNAHNLQVTATSRPRQDISELQHASSRMIPTTVAAPSANSLPVQACHVGTRDDMDERSNGAGCDSGGSGGIQAHIKAYAALGASGPQDYQQLVTPFDIANS